MATNRRVRRRRWYIGPLSSILMILALGGFRPGGAEGARPSDLIQLTPIWTTGIVGDGVGGADIVVTDLTGDGVADTVSCTSAGGGYLYVLKKAPGDPEYGTSFYSQQIDCIRLATGDRNDDGIEEIYVGGSDSQVRVFEGDTFDEISVLSIPGNSSVMGLGVADVDGDSHKELAVVTAESTYVYDALSLTLEWGAIGYGGSQLGGIGQIDNDPRPEIVVNGNPAYVLDPTNRTLKWAYSGGFGSNMAIGDVDGDTKDEFTYFSYSGLYVFDADTLSTKWHVADQIDLSEIQVGDANSDGANEVVTGERQFSALRGWRGDDGSALWTISPSEGGAWGMGIGDADNDGANEALWGGALRYSTPGVLYVGSAQTQTVEWASYDLDGPLKAASDDIDGDGQAEVVLATRSTSGGYASGLVQVYGGDNHRLEWSSVITYGDSLNIYQLAVGQLDADPAQEIAVAGERWYQTRIRVYDGITHMLEWESSDVPTYPPSALIVRNLDDDPVDEMVVGLSNRVLVFNGASPLIQWDSGVLDGPILDVSEGDLDGNGTPELAVLTSQSTYVYEVGSWNLRTQRAASARQVSIARINYGVSGGPGELLLATNDGNVQSLAGDDFRQLWTVPVGGSPTVKEIFSGDLDGNGTGEFVLVGSTGNWEDPSLLKIGSVTDLPTWLYTGTGRWGEINGVALADVDQDGYDDLVFGSTTLVQTDRIGSLGQPTPTPTAISTHTSTPTLVPSNTPTAISTHTQTPTPVAATATATPCGIEFTDVPPASTFYPYVHCLACRGIVSGYPDGTFGPNNPVTRGQLAKIVSNAVGYAGNFATNTFEDVPVGSTFFPYVERLFFHGGIAGYACGNPEPCVPPGNKPYFRPGANVTRGQTSKIVAIAKGLPAPSPGQQTFEDVAPNSTFWQWIEPLAATGAIGGYPCGGAGEPCNPPNSRPYFRPGANVTRGQSAKIVSNIFFPNCSTPGMRK